MGEEMLSGPVDRRSRRSNRLWNKAIPIDRDRLQSQALVWGVGALLAGLCVHTAAFASSQIAQLPDFVLALGTSVAFALVAWRLRAATPAGAACGGMVCLLLTFWLGRLPNSLLRTGLTPLVLLFILTFTATRLGRRRKASSVLAEGRHGRSAAQVVANLGVAGLTASWIGWVGAATLLRWLQHAGQGYDALTASIETVALAALVEAAADTVSSEIGQAFGGPPVLLTTMRRVATGVDGAITATGTLAGVIGAAAMAGAGRWALRLSLRDAAIALVAGVAGLFFDSLLGATVERRGWVGNDLVNFASTLFAAVVALGLLIVAR